MRELSSVSGYDRSRSVIASIMPHAWAAQGSSSRLDWFVNHNTTRVHIEGHLLCCKNSRKTVNGKRPARLHQIPVSVGSCISVTEPPTGVRDGLTSRAFLLRCLGMRRLKLPGRIQRSPPQEGHTLSPGGSEARTVDFVPHTGHSIGYPSGVREDGNILWPVLAVHRLCRNWVVLRDYRPNGFPDPE